MCCGPFDYDYPTFGGKHQRVDRSHGRVGSILSDPANTISGPSAYSNLKALPEPLDSELDEDDSIEAIDGEYENGSSGQRSNSETSPNVDDNLESIEPLRNNKTESDDSTASTLWRPRPLR